MRLSDWSSDVCSSDLLTGCAITVRDDVAFFYPDTRAFKAQPFDITDNACGNQNDLDIDLFAACAIQLDVPAPGVPLLAGDAAAQMQRHALLAQRLSNVIRDFSVFHRQHAIGHLDNVYLYAQGMIEAGEFNADRACTHHQHAFGQARWRQCFAVVPHAISLRIQPRQGPRTRAGSQHNMLGGNMGFGRPAGDGQTPPPRQTGMAIDDRNAVLLHQMAHPALQLCRYLAGSGYDSLQIRLGLSRLDAELACLAHQAQDISRTQHRLGRYATPVQAYAAQF